MPRGGLIGAPFLISDISQGSVVTRLGCGGVFKYEFVTNFLLSRIVKNFENQLTSGEVTDRSIVSCFYLTHSVYITFYLSVIFSKFGRFVDGLRLQAGICVVCRPLQMATQTN